MKLYKFRPLGSKTDFERVKRILNTGEFWCSRFQELNDPMEGVFLTSNPSLVDKIYYAKKNYVICSFSTIWAFKKPAMWGYYANGFKGIAIEVKVNKNSVKKIEYKKEIKSISEYQNKNEIESLLSAKLPCWKHENEYRFLKILDECDNDNFQQIGKITAVYFGNPFGDVDNKEEIYQNNQALRCYKCYANMLKNCLKDVPYYEIKIIGNKVEKMNH